MPSTLTIVWLVIHTTTFHGNGVTVQSVSAVQAKSEAECRVAIAELAAKPQPPNRFQVRICTARKPEFWIEQPGAQS